jgi:hypothetical protein
MGVAVIYARGSRVKLADNAYINFWCIEKRSAIWSHKRVMPRSMGPAYRGTLKTPLPRTLQGYLAHKKTPTPLGPP